MKLILDRSQTTMVVLVLMMLCPILGLALYGYGKYRWADETLTAFEPRYARLLGLKNHKEELDQSEAAISSFLQSHVYPGSVDVSQAGNDAQQRVRDLFVKAGLDLVSIQVLPPKTEKQFDRIPLVVRLEGSLVSLQSALVVLTGQSPSILVDGFTVQTVGAVKAEVAQRLAIQFNLSVLRTSK